MRPLGVSASILLGLFFLSTSLSGFRSAWAGDASPRKENSKKDRGDLDIVAEVAKNADPITPNAKGFLLFAAGVEGRGVLEKYNERRKLVRSLGFDTAVLVQRSEKDPRFTGDENTLVRDLEAVVAWVGMSYQPREFILWATSASQITTWRFINKFRSPIKKFLDKVVLSGILIDEMVVLRPDDLHEMAVLEDWAMQNPELATEILSKARFNMTISRLEGGVKVEDHMRMNYFWISAYLKMLRSNINMGFNGIPKNLRIYLHYSPHDPNLGAGGEARLKEIQHEFERNVVLLTSDQSDGNLHFLDDVDNVLRRLVKKTRISKYRMETQRTRDKRERFAYWQCAWNITQAGRIVPPSSGSVFKYPH